MTGTYSAHQLALRAWNLLRTPNAESEKYFAAELSVLGGGSPSPRAANWVRRLHEYEMHWVAVSRPPRENTRARSTLPDGERRLGEWARYQRRFRDNLSAYQVARLTVSPGFDWDPLEALWLRRVTACEEHLARTHELPRLRQDDPTEFQLARWLARELNAMRHRTLPTDRAARLDDLLRAARRARAAA